MSGLRAPYPMSFAAVQKHVAVLEAAGLVTKQRKGRCLVVRTQPRRPAWRAVLDEYEAVWRGRIDRMTELIANAPENETMTVTAVLTDPDALTLTLTAEFDAFARARLGNLG